MTYNRSLEQIDHPDCKQPVNTSLSVVVKPYQHNERIIWKEHESFIAIAIDRNRLILKGQLLCAVLILYNWFVDSKGISPHLSVGVVFNCLKSTVEVIHNQFNKERTFITWLTILKCCQPAK